ncbi:hypothetical protein AVEN_81419-1 [Araneus ventricosus]|uniref:EGF-like domain-containing protein n=1 Tax=Araneus ventricosus TaxID=182803 RepID=A0A4Y2R3C0_ARAVE|nr:hypothetical protein AVEN_81419-1 [Araneus ventricosus]
MNCLRECDCGPYGTCYFENGKKICSCKQFFGEKFGKCVECYCGMQSWSCRFSSRGEKVCDCKPGHAQKNGTCVGKNVTHAHIYVLTKEKTQHYFGKREQTNKNKTLTSRTRHQQENPIREWK